MRVLALLANGATVRSIYVFGERNSVTNYLSNLIIKNCKSQGGGSLYGAQNRAALGWKHGFPAMLGAFDDVLAIAVYRDPIAWLHALHRDPWHAAAHLRNVSFSQFIRSEWMSVIDDKGFGVVRGDPRWGHELLADRDPETGGRFANAMRLRNAKNRGFASLDNRVGNVLRVNYEAVYADPQGFLTALCGVYNLKRHGQLNPIEHDRGTPARGIYQPKPLPETTAADMDFIRQELDLQTEQVLGYDLPPPAQCLAA
jgi:hypothetical protein